MKLFNKVAIIGVGLIGGSVGLAIKERGIAGEVIGVFRRGSTLKKALSRRAVDKAVMDISEGVRDADLIIIATPVCSIPAIAREVFRYAKRGAIVIDAGSTKRWIVKSVERTSRKSHPGIAFVGSHPMAGSAETGVVHAKKDLLKDAACIVTKTGKTGANSLRKVIIFWKAIGAKVGVMSPAEHDRCASFISHLPHVVAFSAAGIAPLRYIRYAAEGFRDTTRVASSDPELWADIFLTNKDEIYRSARLFEKRLRDIIKSISADDRRRLVGLLRRAKIKRDAVSHEG